MHNSHIIILLLFTCAVPSKMRLVGKNEITSPLLTAGRVEIFFVGQWGSVCSFNQIRLYTSRNTACKIITGQRTATAMISGRVGQNGLG